MTRLRAGQDFTKLEVKVVKLSLRYKFVLKFRKFAPFLHKQTGQYRKVGWKCVGLPLKFNRGPKTEKAQCSILGIHLVLQFGDEGFSGLFRKCYKE